MSLVKKAVLYGKIQRREAYCFMKSIRTKINVVVIVAILLLTTILTVYNYQSKKQDLFSSAEHKLLSDLTLSKAFVDEKIPGEWQIKNNELVKGTTSMNDNNTLLDHLKELTQGNTYTIVQNNVRVATTESGNEGTTVDPAVTKQVIEQKENYIGQVDVNGKLFFTVYEPILSQNEVIGMLSVAVPADTYLTILNQSTMTNIIISVILLVIAIVMVSLFVSKQIVKPIQGIRNTALAVAKLDLTTKLFQPKGQDEISQLAEAFHTMQLHLQEVAGQLQHSSTQVADSSKTLAVAAEQTSESVSEVSQTINEIATQVTSQAEGAHHIADTMTDMVTEVEQNDSNVQKAVLKAKESTVSAQKGYDTIQEAATQLQTVMQTAEQSRQSVERLGDYSSQIDNIITVITNIADQTNLLALNAAIEAARAGEQGKGFAVVADEVRQLAEQSSESAQQITTLITNIQSEIMTTVHEIQQNIAALKLQNNLVQESGQSFDDIVEKIQETEQAMSYLQAFIAKMNGKVDEVRQFTAAIMETAEDSAAVTEEVAANSEEQLAVVEEITASIEELSQISNNLKQEADKFSI